MKSTTTNPAVTPPGAPPTSLLALLFLLLAVACSPLVLGRLLSPAGGITRPVLAATLSLAAACAAPGMILLFRRIRPPPLLARFAFALCWFGLLFVGSIGVDRILGKLPGRFRQGILMPPGSEAYYEATEFKFTAKINGLGFRDREVLPGKSPGRRVIVVGDSFTFGWGVEQEQTWVKLVEKQLRERDPSIEVLNLGAGGASPIKYLATVRNAVPILRPDLVVIAMLEGDDMQQLLEDLDRDQERVQGTGSRPSLWAAAKGFVQVRLYPNLSRPRAGRQEIRPTWQAQVQTITNKFTDITRPRFEAVSSRVKESFLDGGLNPMWLMMALKKPDYFQAMNRTNDPVVQRGIKELATCFSEIWRLSESVGAKVLVAAVPHRAYMTPRESAEMAALGYSADPTMLTSGGATEAIRRASQTAGLAFTDVDAEFRATATTDRLYYEFDAHFNVAGNARFAELMAPRILEALPPRP